MAQWSKAKVSFGSKLKEILNERANISSLESSAIVEIRDLDYLAKGDDVQKAVKRNLGNFDGELKVSVTDTNSKELGWPLST